MPYFCAKVVDSNTIPVKIEEQKEYHRREASQRAGALRAGMGRLWEWVWEMPGEEGSRRRDFTLQKWDIEGIPSVSER